MQSQGSVIVVTGGASGLGAGCVRRFVNLGAKVAILDTNDVLGEALAKETGAFFCMTDVTDEASVQTSLEKIVAKFGEIHAVINCAGIAPPAKILGKDGVHSLELFRKVIEINLIGTFNILRLVSGVMAKNTPNNQSERGVIINTASVAAFDGQIGQVAYSASKGGVAAMTLPAARELARYGIRVMTIAPGLFHTPLFDGLPAEAVASLGQQVPFPPRLGQPDEYAQLAQQIIENTMLNGETIRLDGAIRMAPK